MRFDRCFRRIIGIINRNLYRLGKVILRYFVTAVRAGSYLLKSHAVQHAIKEGFNRQHIVEAIITGTIIEEYPDEQRVLVCGRTTPHEKVEVFLHVVCEYADPVYAEVVTAYIPDELEWEKPPFKRRKRKRK